MTLTATQAANIEAVRTIADKGRFGLWDEIRPYISDDIVIEVPQSLPWGGTRHGWQGYLDTMAGLGGSLSDIGPGPIEYFPISEEEVVLRVTFKARVNHTGKNVVVPALEIFKLKDGKVCGLKAFYYDTKDIADP